MQERNLKALVSKKKAKPWYYWLNPLNYTPRKLYRLYLDNTVGFYDGVATYYYYDEPAEVNEFDLSDEAEVYTLPKSRAKVEEFTLKELKKRRSFSLNLQMRKPKISNPLEFNHPVKWVLLNLRRTVRIREGRLTLRKSPTIRAYKDFSVTRRLRLKSIDSKRLHLKDYIPVNQEIVEIEPYLRSEKLDTIYQLPLIKKQVNKGLISQRSLEKIRTLLAQHASVKPVDIEIVGVYENFQYELYKGIKHNAQTGNVLCFLDSNKRAVKKPKRPYLLIGKKRSSGQSFTVLADKDKLAL